jgi:LemA protein
MKIFITIMAVMAAILIPIFMMGGCAAGTYNSCVSMEQKVNQSWSQVLNVYQRRYDLIPNLVATVKGVANFEKDTFTQVAKARASVGQVTIDQSKSPESAEQLQKFQAAQGNISQALSRLMVVSEQYPQLKANENFLNLQAQIEGTENRISVERKTFNDAVQSYNTYLKTFPNNFILGFFSFKEKPYFQNSQESNQAPVVNFN